jgi:hypothetical protein
MSESAEGVSVAATRQTPSTDFADVTCAFGSASEAIASHATAGARPWPETVATNKTAIDPTRAILNDITLLPGEVILPCG